MKNKQGISLIVLIVTIIVIIILAAAVILTLNQNNPIDSSRIAQLAENRSSLNSAVNLYYGKKMAETQGVYDPKDIFMKSDKISTDHKDVIKIAIVNNATPTDATPSYEGKYYPVNTDNFKELTDASVPDMSDATWYMDVTTGLLYLVYPGGIDKVPNWMYTDGDEKTSMDKTLSEFVKVPKTEGETTKLVTPEKAAPAEAGA